MYNVRYHIASLLGVFLALALGLVLGGLVVERGGMQSQQDALIKGLQKEFSSLRTENVHLTEQNELLASLSGDLTGVWGTDRLVGRTFLVVTTGEQGDGQSAVTEAIESAGGSVALVRIEEPGFGLEDEAVRSRVTSEGVDFEAARASVVASLAAEWSAPMQDRPMTQALIDAGELSLQGLEAGVLPAGLVDLADRENKPDADGLDLAEAFAEAGGVAVAGQTTDAGNGVAAAGATLGLGALDTLGTELGRYTLIALLSGAEPAYYGLAEQAVSGYPSPADLR